MPNKVELIYRANRMKNEAGTVHRYMKLQSYLIYIQRQGKIKNVQFDFEDYSVFEEKMKEAIESCKSIITKEVLVSILNNKLNYIRDSANDTYKQLLECEDEELLEVFKIETIMDRSSMYCECITEDYLSELVMKLHEGRSNKNIIDLCLGQGRFLSVAAKSYPKSQLTGIELMELNVIDSKMILDMMSSNYSIFCGDLIHTPCTPDYDLVFCDYPRGMLPGNDIFNDKDSVFSFDHIRREADWAFAGKAINSMNKNGRAYVLMSARALNSSSERRVRKQVIDNGLLEMSISFSADSRFYKVGEYSLLVFSKGNKTVKMVDATSFCDRVGENIIKVDEIVEAINNNSSEYVKVIDNETIINNSYKLNSNTYFMEKIVVPHAKKLKTVAETFRGVQYTSKQYTELNPGEGKYDILKISDINDDFLECTDLASIDIPEKKAERYLLKDNDILIVSKGYVLKIAYVKDLRGKQVIPTGNLSVIRVTDKKVSPLYLFIFLMSHKGQALLDQCLVGSTIKSLSKKELDAMDIPAIDLDTQKEIENKYIFLQDRIEELKKVLNNLKEKQNSIFESEVES